MITIFWAVNQTTQYGDYMSALLISSTAFLITLSLFLGFARQYRKETKKRLPRIIIWSQVISFVIGILTIMAILDYLFFKEINNVKIIVALFGLQAMAFVIGTVPFWIEFVGSRKEEIGMTKVNKLNGCYLDSQFRRVEIYVCEKSSFPHQFDIPVDANLQTKEEKNWLKDLKNGKCPLC